MTKQSSSTEPAAAFGRRRALKAGALGAAGVWVAPAIDSMITPAAAASCLCSGAGTINWSTGTGISGASPTGIAGYNSPGWLVGTFNTVAVRFRFSGNTASPYFLRFPAPSPDCLTGWQQTCQNGNVTGIFGIDKSGASINARVTLDIDFSCDVRNLSFTILDIDSGQVAQSPGQARINYRDQVVVQAFRGATPVAGTYTPVNGATSTFTPTAAQSGTGPFTFTALAGNNSTGNNTTLGNLTVSIPGPVSRFSLSYDSVHGFFDGSNSGTLQEVALSNLSWQC